MSKYPHENTTARVRQWQYLTGADFKAMDRKNTVVMVTCSPLEVHGPHLPVITDNHEAECISVRTMEILSERNPNLEFVHLPPIYVAADVVPQPGSVAFRTSTIVRVLEDMGRSLAAQGFEHIWVASFHGGPRHFVAIEEACHRVNRRHNTKMVSAFSLLINLLTGGNTDVADVVEGMGGITRADLEGDTHGGAVETSMMLHLLGEYVDKAYEALPRRTVNTVLEEGGHKPLTSGKPSLGELFRGFKHKLKFYETWTYSGKPAVASAEAGQEMLEAFANHTANALEEVWKGQRSLEDCHSPLWKVRWVFTFSPISKAFERAVGYKSQVW